MAGLETDHYQPSDKVMVI